MGFGSFRPRKAAQAHPQQHVVAPAVFVRRRFAPFSTARINGANLSRKPAMLSGTTVASGLGHPLTIAPMNAPIAAPACPLCGQSEAQLVKRQPAQKDFQPAQAAAPAIYLQFRCPCGVTYLIDAALMDRAKSA